MDAGPEKVGRKNLSKGSNSIVSQDSRNHDYDQFVFTGCRGIEPDEITIQINLKSPDWQIGFYDADGEVYFKKVKLGNGAAFSSLVRNHWWNGKEESERREGFYSLIKSVEVLEIETEGEEGDETGEQLTKDLADYAEGKYQVGGNWELCELNKNMEIKIVLKGDSLALETVKRLMGYFNNVSVDSIYTSLQVENIIDQECEDKYIFVDSRKANPRKLVINAKLMGCGILILFNDTDSEVHIPEITIDEQGSFDAIVSNAWQNNKEDEEHKFGFYSLIQHVETLTIRNNPGALKDFADYAVGEYKIEDDDWKLQQLNKDIKVVIEGPRDAFLPVSRIQNYFTDVVVDGRKPEEYLAAWGPWNNPDYKAFVNCFKAYDLIVDPPERPVDAARELVLENCYDIRGPIDSIDSLTIRQKMGINCVVCFHDTSKPVTIDKIVIQDGGDLRCVLQNAYYNGTDSGFFSLLQTAKELKIHSIYSNRYADNQVLIDLADYIEGKYSLNANWKQEELDKDMRINIDNGRCSLSLSVAQRLRNYFKNVSIDRIYTPLQTENVIDQECEAKYIFGNCIEASPQKLLINAKLMDSGTLILFNWAEDEVHIPEIIIEEKGCFAAIMRNAWQNNKVGNEYKSGYYSLVQYVETLTIMNNPGALKDFADYVVGKYEIEKNKRQSHWELYQLSKNIKIVIQGPGDVFLDVLRISNYFDEVTVDGKQPENYLSTWELWDDPDYKAFRTCFGVHGFLVEPLQYDIEFQRELELVGYVYNIRKAKDSIDLLTVRQKLDINQFVCFHNINKPVTVNKIIIDDIGDLRNVIQNAYYSNGQGGFFSLLKTVKRLEISNNEQAAEDLADYVDGKYTLHPKWVIQALDKDMMIKIHHDRHAFSLDVAIRLRNYFGNVSIDCVWTPLETENVIDQGCEDYYVFGDCRNANPQKLVVNAKLQGNYNLILFNDADGEVRIPEITIGEHGSFDTIVRNQWQNCKNDSEEKYGNYSLVSHVETLTIQNNLGAVCDLADYLNGNYKTGQHWNIQQLNKEIKIRIENIGIIQNIPDAQNNVKKIKKIEEYFNDVIVGGHQFSFLGLRLRTTGLNNALEARAKLTLAKGVYNVKRSEYAIDQLTIDQELETNQFICFHNFNAPVSINMLVIKEKGNLRNIIQNAYYNKGHIGFFSLMETVKTLEIHGNNKAMADLVDYVECRYNLNNNWKMKLLDKNIKVIVYCHENVTSIIHRLQKYFSTVQYNIQANVLVQNFWRHNAIQMDCNICYFVSCQSITPHHLLINSRISSKIVGFCDTDNEVHIPHIMIASLGQFSSIVHNCNSQNGWSDNNKEWNYYSLVNHIKTLTIEENNQAVSDLARYIQGQYDLDERWKYGAVPHDVKIIINDCSSCVVALSFLLNNINEIFVNGNPGIQYVTAHKNAFQKHVMQYYKGLELKDIACSAQFSKHLKFLSDVYHVDECDVQIDEIVVQQQISENQFICFHGAQQKPKIYKIVMDEDGCLRTILQNMLWCSGQSKLFTLITCCETLVIWDNSRALKDLADYVERRYQLNRYWECETIKKTIKLETSATSDDILVIKKLKIRFSNVSIKDLSISVQPTTVIDEPCEKCTFIQEKHTQSNGNQKLNLVINAAISDDIIMSNEEIKFSNVTIGPHGKLENIIYNCYENGNDLVRYSILSNVEVLTIQNNQDAIKCLAMYVSGKYQLMQGWSVEKPSENTYIHIQYARVQDDAEIDQIKDYFIRVAVQGAKIPLADKNIIDTSFINYTFTNCRDTKPKTLSINAPLRDSVIRFTQADKPVCIPKIQIGSNGSIQSLVHNQWGEDEQTPLEFSLLAFAKELTIINNQQAVQDLLAYVTEYQGKSRAMRPNKNMWVRIIGSEISDEINKLADYFGLVAVDNTIVLSNDKNKTKESINRRNQYLKEIHKQIDDKRGEIFDKEMKIRNQLEKAKQRYRRRRQRFREYLALAE